MLLLDVQILSLLLESKTGGNFLELPEPLAAGSNGGIHLVGCGRVSKSHKIIEHIPGQALHCLPCVHFLFTSQNCLVKWEQLIVLMWKSRLREVMGCPPHGHSWQVSDSRVLIKYLGVWIQNRGFLVTLSPCEALSWGGHKGRTRET